MQPGPCPTWALLRNNTPFVNRAGRATWRTVARAPWAKTHRRRWRFWWTTVRAAEEETEAKNKNNNNNERRTTNNERQATNDERATNDEQRSKNQERLTNVYESSTLHLMLPAHCRIANITTVTKKRANKRNRGRRKANQGQRLISFQRRHAGTTSDRAVNSFSACPS